MVDFLIVGQGLAGSLLHFFLHQAGKSCLLIDKGSDKSASAVASGLINPITGRKYVKSWMYDDLYPFARDTYLDLEKLLGVEIYKEHRILRVLSSIQEENLWYSKTSLEINKNYFVEDADAGPYQEVINNMVSVGEVQGAAKVNTGVFIKSYRKYLIEQNQLLEQRFDFDQMRIESTAVSIGNLKAKHVVFCEGWKMKTNPYFKDLTLEPAKGEFLLVRIPNFKFSKSIKKKIFISPYKEDIYWVGSTYEWDFTDVSPTDAKREYLEKALADMLRCPYEILSHGAGVRPSTLDRRPFLGTHPQYRELSVFNGLGTKGASIGPYFAKMMSDVLIDGAEILAEVDISR